LKPDPVLPTYTKSALLVTHCSFLIPPPHPQTLVKT
jgi:hypothetical protein